MSSNNRYVRAATKQPAVYDRQTGDYAPFPSNVRASSAAKNLNNDTTPHDALIWLSPDAMSLHYGNDPALELDSNVSD